MQQSDRPTPNSTRQVERTAQAGSGLRRNFTRFSLLALVLGALLVLPVMRPRQAAAHPLGNFTINRYARIEPEAAQIRVVYALDMAEIPTFQEMNLIDRDRNGAVSDQERDAYLAQKAPELARNLVLTVNTASVPLQPVSSGLSFSDGQGGLQILRVDAVFVGDLPAGARGGTPTVTFRDSNYDDRIGWKEIVVRGTQGAAVRESTVSAENTSDELRSYPNNLLQSPLNQKEARFSFEPGVAGAVSGGSSTGSTAAQVADRTKRAVSPGVLSKFAESASKKDLTLQVMLFSLLAAIFWGGLHALGPGHGKTVVAAYLVGSRGTPRHAAFLGLTVTATHTASTYVLGAVTLFASHYIVPEKLYPVLSLASGLMVMGMGLTLLISRLRGRRPHAPKEAVAAAYELGRSEKPRPAGGHSHGFGFSHAHGGAQGRPTVAAQGRPVTKRSLLALGVYGGMIPCPTAIVVLLISISLNRIAFGMMLVVAFSVGLAAVLMLIGFTLVYAGRTFSRLSRFKGAGALGAAVPVMSAAMVIVAGLLITLRAAGQSGIPLI